MGLEAATYIDDFVTSNPTDADSVSSGDDHLRLIKAVLKTTLPGLSGALQRVLGKTIGYTVLATDNHTLVNYTGSGGVTLALTAVATLGNKFHFAVNNGSSGNVTVDPNGAELINGAATLVLLPGQGCFIWCDGSAFYAFMLPNYSNWATYTPTLTLVGGAGNTVPTYTGQSFSRWMQIGKRVEVDIDLVNSSGGTAGAGTGQVNVALPVAVSASASATGTIEPVGFGGNASTFYFLQGVLAESATTILLNYMDLTAGASLTFDGAHQNNTARKLRLHFSYPVD